MRNMYRLTTFSVGTFPLDKYRSLYRSLGLSRVERPEQSAIKPAGQVLCD